MTALLNDDRYKLQIIYLYKHIDNEIVGHALYVYQENGKGGSIGTTAQDDRLAQFSSLQELVESLPEEYNIISKDYLINLDMRYPSNE